MTVAFPRLKWHTKIRSTTSGSAENGRRILTPWIMNHLTVRGVEVIGDLDGQLQSIFCWQPGRAVAGCGRKGSSLHPRGPVEHYSDRLTDFSNRLAEEESLTVAGRDVLGRR